MVNIRNDDFKALKSNIKVIQKKHIDKIYSITPALLKDEGGYWKKTISIDDFERRLKENLIKKYNEFNKAKISEYFNLYTTIEFKNKIPISTKYKNINLLGDKLSLNISDHKLAQDLAYMSLGVGILEMNAVFVKIVVAQIFKKIVPITLYNLLNFSNKFESND